MNRADAVLIAEDLVSELVPLCEKIEIAGSIRRNKAWVNDIDLVLIPKPYHNRNIRQRLYILHGRAAKKDGPKYIMLEHFRMRGHGQPINVDLYLADTTTWATLLLIRTGSKQHNIKLCQRAREIGLKLNADGHGLTLISKDVNMPVHTEQQIFERLGLPFREPWEREV